MKIKVESLGMWGRKGKSLCDMLSKISRGVRKEIDEAFKVGVPYWEETVTQRVLLRLKKEQPRAIRIFSVPFLKRQESFYGADFDLWIRDDSGLWLGLRVQAKIIDPETARFKNLFYKRNEVYQVNILIESAKKDKALPIYLLYVGKNKLNTGKNKLGNLLGYCPYGKRAHQWANWWLSAEYVRQHIGARGADSLQNIASEKAIWPWQCFACCSFFCPLSVCSQYWRISENFLCFFQDKIQAMGKDYAAQVLKMPPDYVQLAYEELFAEPPGDMGNIEGGEKIENAMSERGLAHLAVLDLRRL